MTEQQQTQEKAERARAALRELYGDDEKTLIVLNKRGTIISVGFGELGDKMGHQIPNTKLPIVLTDLFPPKTWLDSPDFRKCMAQGWLELISQEEADSITRDYESRQARLRALAGQQQDGQRADRLSDVVPGSTPMVLDEDTATLIPADQDPRARQAMEYLAQHGDPAEQTEARKALGRSVGPNSNRGPAGEDREQTTASQQVDPAGDQLNAKALQIIEGLRKKTVEPSEALVQLDDLCGEFSEDDLQYIAANTGKFPGIRTWATEALASRAQ